MQKKCRSASHVVNFTLFFKKVQACFLREFVIYDNSGSWPDQSGVSNLVMEPQGQLLIFLRIVSKLLKIQEEMSIMKKK